MFIEENNKLFTCSVRFVRKALAAAVSLGVGLGAGDIVGRRSKFFLGV